MNYFDFTTLSPLVKTLASMPIQIQYMFEYD